MSLTESDESVPISALQHFVYCPRQVALIHVERVWQDNQLTALGHVVHARADQRGRDQRRGTRVERAVPLACRAYGIHGVADAVEWVGEVARPVETKRGPVAERSADRVQLCAQALCLEEMLSVRVDVGVLFYAASHKRVEVAIDEALRGLTRRVIDGVRDLIRHAVLPVAEPGPKCRRCSLKPICRPEVSARQAGASRYLTGILNT